MIKNRKGKLMMMEYTTEMTTEATQLSIMCDLEKKSWMRILEIIKHVFICYSRSPSTLAVWTGLKSTSSWKNNTVRKNCIKLLKKCKLVARYGKG